MEKLKCVIETEGVGDMVFVLYPMLAPITVKNFVDTVKSGFYDGLAWCRIVKGYVIQGGSPDNDIMTDSGWHIKGEFAENGINNPILHKRGAISMARDDDYDTAGTQFFVVHEDAAKLDGRYAAFGQMTEGFDVLDQIASVPTGGPETWNKPDSMPVIRKIYIEDCKAEQDTDWQ
ncbi:MAG: peptidylprolyl isomerase [Lachnospiraceae bacterium]|nr:peptidylprolyl isomerase [Lachnospiraceae bacterium]